MLPDWISGSTLEDDGRGHRQPEAYIDLGRTGAGQQQVVETPVRGEGSEATFTGDDQQRGFLAGRLDQPTERPGADQVPPGIQQDDIGGRSIEQGGGFSLGDFDLMGQQFEGREDLPGCVHIVGEQQQGGHVGLLRLGIRYRSQPSRDPPTQMGRRYA